MSGTEKLRNRDLKGNEINRRVVLAAAGVGIAAGAASLLVACDKHGEPSSSPEPETRQPGQLELEIPRSAFGNGEGTYTVLLCNDTLISDAELNAMAGDHKLPQPVLFDGGEHILIVRPSTGREWTHPVQLPTVDHYEIDSVSVSVPDEGSEKGIPPFGFKVAAGRCNRFEVCSGGGVCSVRG